MIHASFRPIDSETAKNSIANTIRTKIVPIIFLITFRSSNI